MKHNKMKSIPALFVLITSLCVLTSNGQTGGPYTVRGQVIDSNSLAPLEFATIGIINKSTSLEKKVLTDKAGNFIIEKLSAGQYELMAVVSGYKTKAINANFSDTLNYVFDAGKIMLTQNVKQLREVTLVTKKPLITQEIDRISYNVQEDPDNKIINMLDMMRKIPFISVTGEDQVLFNGNSNFRVLLDGRNSSLLSLRNLKDVLKSMPASSILQVEVITMPPARYESEGLAGIINIITNKKLKDGYNGSINANYSRLFSGSSGSINVKKGKFGLTGFAGTSWEKLPLSPFKVSLSQITPTHFEFQQNGDRRYDGNTIYGNAFISFEPDSLHLFTASVGMNTGTNENKKNQYSELFNETGTVAQSYNLYSVSKTTDNGWDMGFNFQKGFKRIKTQLLTMSYRYVTFLSDLHNSNFVSQKVNYTVNDINQTNISGLHEHSAQLDYVHPVKTLTIEAGTKFILRNKSGNFSHFDFNSSTGQFVQDPGKSDILDYDQTIFSIYNSYSIRKKKWAFRAGFRLEATKIDASFKHTNTILTRDYTNLVPSFSFLFRPKDISTVSIGYTQRIQRPGIQLLNPFTDQSDPRFFRSGNPNLLPVLNHNIVANYSRFKKSTINLGLTYSFARNTIQSVASSQGGDSVIRITYMNIGRYDNTGVNMNLTIPLSKSITLTANGTISYVWTEGIIENKETKNKGIEGFAYSYLSCRAKKNWRFSLNTGFYGPVRNLQGNSNSYLYSSVSASKQLFKQKGSVSLSISNPFQRFRTLETVVIAPSFYQQTINKNYFRNINVGFYYRFGKLSEEIKRNRRNINNDDKAVETGKAQ